MPSEASRRIRASFVKAEGVSDVPIAVQRAEWETAAAQTPLPPGTLIEPLTLGTVACERVWFETSDRSRVLVWLHGGGFNAGSCVTHRDLAARLALASGIVVVLVDYRLAPEHPFPAAVEDTVAVLHALQRSDDPPRIAIGGDSAGGGLALSALLAMRNAAEPLPHATVLLSPWLDLALAGTSMDDRATIDPMTTRAGLHHAAQLYLAGHDPRDPAVSPMYADLHGLPPMLVHVGDHEVLLSDAERLAARAQAAGVAVRLHVWEAMWHVFPAFGDLPEAQQALDEVGVFLRQTLAR